MCCHIVYGLQNQPLFLALVRCNLHLTLWVKRLTNTVKQNGSNWLSFIFFIIYSTIVYCMIPTLSSSYLESIFFFVKY